MRRRAFWRTIGDLKIGTWNVNGIRARQEQVLGWIAREQPDVVCLQEIKASIDQLTFPLLDIEGYWGHWHGGKGYSGVALLISKAFAPDGPSIVHPVFDFEQRICTATISTAAGAFTLASIYVPNGGKDFAAKMRFSKASKDGPPMRSGAEARSCYAAI